jgi:nucleoid DNA-binding protein
MALSKDELIQILVKQIGLNSPEAREMIERLHGEITASPVPGDGVELTRNGELPRRTTEERDAGEPAAGEALPGEARRIATLPPRRNAGGAGGKTPRGS